MNNFFTHSDNKKSYAFYLIVAVVLLFNMTAFGQSAEQNVVVSANVETATNDVKEAAAVRSSGLEFVLWFMTSKQNPNSTISNEGVNAKKQIMTSGLTPNRLLIKAFLKKAVNFESALT